jgi:hypothetical protein
MTDHRTEMIMAEDRGWNELCDLVERLDPHRLDQPGYSDEWSVKDLLGHLAAWWAEAAHALERIRMGTYTSEKLDIDGMNRRFFEAFRDTDADTVRAELWASRNRALEELWRLPEITKDADEWFMESGAEHYQEHLPELRRFVEEAKARGASAG